MQPHISGLSCHALRFASSEIGSAGAEALPGIWADPPSLRPQRMDPFVSSRRASVQGLIRRVALLECRAASVGAVEKDFRVIEMQISRAEEKIMRLERASSWARSEVSAEDA